MGGRGNFLSIGLISVALGVAALVLAESPLLEFEAFLKPDSPLFFPAIIAIALLINGLGMLVVATRHHRISTPEAEERPERVDVRVWFGLLALFLYWASMPWIGFWASSALVIVVLAVLFRATSFIRIISLALAFPYLVIQLFWNAGHIILPQAIVFQ